jgi:shikimate kinase
MARHIVLVGLMGSGKTTIGRRVAARLSRPFVDADEALEAAAGRSVADIFGADGEDAFRDLETTVLEDLVADSEPQVVASGGGVVLRAANRARLRGDDITVVWLDAEPAFLASRIERKAHRPLLTGDTSPRDVLTRLHLERAPLYAEVADVVVEVAPFHRSEDKPKDALADRIVALVLEHEAAA